MGKKAKRKMKKHHVVNRQSRASVFFESRTGKVVLFAGVIAAIAVISVLAVFLFTPTETENTSDEKTTTLVKNPFRDSLNADAEPDARSYNLSENVKEAKLQILTAIDPYIYGDEIVFTSSSMSGGALKYNLLYIYDCTEEKETQVPGITVKYDNILFPRMNEDYIVFLDSSLSGGGRVCVYDRNTKKQYAVKDYLYAAPEVSLAGNTIAFMQQAGESLDRLYMMNLDTMESTAYRVLSGLPLAPSAVDACGSIAVYSLPYRTQDGFDRSRIYILNLRTGEETEYDPGKLIYDIRTNGEQTAFLASSTGMPTDLYYLNGVTPRLLASDVVNFDMGSGYAAYTKDDAVYAYCFADKIHYKLNSDISRAFLCCSDGNMICMMDVTGGFDDTVNTIKYLEVDLDG